MLFVSRPVWMHIFITDNHRTAYGDSSRRCFVSAWLEQVRLCSLHPPTLFISHPVGVINKSLRKYVMIAHKKECQCRHPSVLCFIFLQQTIHRNILLHFFLAGYPNMLLDVCLEWYPTPRNIRCCSLLVATPYIACKVLWIVSPPWENISPLQCCCCYVAFVLHLYHTLKGVVPIWNNCGMNGGLLEEREWLREGTLIFCNAKIRLSY